MAAAGKEFIGLVPPKAERPRSAFFGSAGLKSMLRDQFSLTTWLCIGAAAQGLLFLAMGRLAVLPSFLILAYRIFTAYAMSVGWMHNTYMDGVIMKKTSAQFPDAQGKFSSKPADNDVVVFLIGTRCNHPMGALAPGFREMGALFPRMVKDLDEHAEEFGYLGMTSWLNNGNRETQSELLEVGYFRTVEGLHKFAHSEYHRDAWAWWNRAVKQYPHMSIYHETFHVPKGHWETIYINSHPSHLASSAHKITDEKTGEELWASPIVDASKGLLKTSAGRMSRSNADEHDKYDDDPYQ